jgi:hypothetical protein
MAPKSELPPDGEAEQVWRDPGLGQHYKVDHVVKGAAALHRCTPGGRVLNQRYTDKVTVQLMQTAWELVSGR